VRKSTKFATFLSASAALLAIPASIQVSPATDSLLEIRGLQQHALLRFDLRAIPPKRFETCCPAGVRKVRVVMWFSASAALRRKPTPAQFISNEYHADRIKSL